MARSKEMAGKVERLQMALERAKAEFPDGHVFETSTLMTELIGCSWPTLRDWINDNPSLERPDLFTRGGNGVKWQFKVVPFIAALLEIFLADAEVKTKANAEIRRKIGVDLPEAERASSLDETRKLIGMTLELNQARMSQGLQTPTQEFLDLFGEFVSDTVEGIMGLGIATDPNGKLPPAIHAEFNEQQRSLATQIHAKWSKRIEARRASLEQIRII